MDGKSFEEAKRSLDREIDELPANPNVGIKFGLSLYSEFRRRGLFESKVVDFILWKWMLPSYRGLFVCEGPGVDDTGYVIGAADA